MGDKYNHTVLSDNEATFGSPFGEYESQILNLDLVDPCEYVEDSEVRMEDYCEKVVLDSDDEAGDERETWSSYRRDIVGFPKRQRVPPGYYHDIGDELTDHEIAHFHSTNIGRKCLHTGVGLQDDTVVTVGGTSSLTDQKPIRSCAREFKADPLCLDKDGESLSDDSFSLGKLNSDGSKYIRPWMDRNYEYEAADVNFFEYLESVESQGKALEFVDCYLSAIDLGSCKDVESRDTDRIKSPPSLSSKGVQCLARNINLSCSPSKSMISDWQENQIEKDDHVSLGILSDSILELGGGKSEELSVNLEANSQLSQRITEKCENFILEPDAFGIGMDTQMAVEAMEALIHAFPPMSNACFSSRGSDDNNLESSFKETNMIKCASNSGPAFVDWRCKKRRSKEVNISIVQDKAVPYLGAKRFKNQKGPGSNMEARNSVTNEILMNKRTRVSQNAELRVYRRRLKDPEDERQSDHHPGERNMINFHGDSSQVGPCLEFKFGPSLGLKPETTKCVSNPIHNEAERNPSKLNIWMFPKRKRSGLYASSVSVGSSSLRSPCAGNVSNKGQYILTNKGACERVAGVIVYSRRSKTSLEREQIIGSSSNLSEDSGSPSIPVLQIETSARQDSSKQKYLGNKSSWLPRNHLSRSPLMKELMKLGYQEWPPDFLPKVARRKRSTEKVCILFSHHMETSILKRQKKIVARLRFSIASSCSDATHFVANEFVRTKNMLEAIALGKPVVTHLWLEGCEQAGYHIDEKNYILRDAMKEKEYGFSLPVSLSRATRHPLLKGKRVLITPTVKPSIDVVRVLVLATAGQEIHIMWNSEAEDKVSPEDLLILSSDEDHRFCLQFLATGAPIYSSELLLNGIIKQKLEYERYQLFKDLTKRGLVENR